MVLRRFHYDQAFEHYLRSKRIPYVAVDEARRALQGPTNLKNFDFVVYGEGRENLLVDVKGRKHTGRSRKQLDNWVSEDDIAHMLRWESIFGDGFKATLVFLYWCEAQPPDALFMETFSHAGRWYTVLAITVEAYQQHMKQRSPKWHTVNMPAEAFTELSQPLMEML